METVSETVNKTVTENEKAVDKVAGEARASDDANTILANVDEKEYTRVKR